jgi:hypothetical protein
MLVASTAHAFQLQLPQYQPDHAHVLDMLHTFPTWQQHLPVTALPASPAVINALQLNNIHQVADMIPFGAYGMALRPRMGPKTMASLSQSLIELRKHKDDTYLDVEQSAVHLFRKYRFDKPAETTANTFVEALPLLLQELPVRYAEILFRRIGIYEDPATLESLGKEQSISRERIRQLEAEGFQIMRESTLWAPFHSGYKTIMRQLNTLEDPLTLAALELKAPWFSGISKYPYWLEYVLRHGFQPRRAYMTQWNFNQVIIDIPQAACSAVIGAVQTPKGKRNLTATALRRRIDLLIPSSGPATRALLLRQSREKPTDRARTAALEARRIG